MDINKKIEEAIVLIKEIDNVAYKFREVTIYKIGNYTPDSLKSI